MNGPGLLSETNSCCELVFLVKHFVRLLYMEKRAGLLVEMSLEKDECGQAAWRYFYINTSGLGHHERFSIKITLPRIDRSIKRACLLTTAIIRYLNLFHAVLKSFDLKSSMHDGLPRVSWMSFRNLIVSMFLKLRHSDTRPRLWVIALWKPSWLENWR